MQHSAQTHQRLARARGLFTDEPVSLVLVSSRRVYRRFGRGIEPLYQLVTRLPSKELTGSSLADKIVGKAAALLILDARLSAVYADVISQRALDLLSRSDVLVEANSIVDVIFNRDRTDLCPMESLTSAIDVPSLGKAAIKEQLERWRMG